VIETIVDTDQLFNILPFRKVTGSGLLVTWEKEIPVAGFIGATDTVPQSEGLKLDQFTENVRIIARNIDIPKFATEVEGAPVLPFIKAEIKARERLIEVEKLNMEALRETHGEKNKQIHQQTFFEIGGRIRQYINNCVFWPRRDSTYGLE